MQKKYYLLSVILLLILIISIICTTPKSNSYKIDRLSIKSINPKQLPIARIIIPKIKLDGKLYNKNSSQNDVDKNIQILKESILPEYDNDSIIFLAAHSGNAQNAYFNNLDKLEINDYLIFQYKKYNYFYKIDEIIEQDKDGDIEINKTSNNQLVLTTCSKKDIHKQLIISSSLKEKEEIMN